MQVWALHLAIRLALTKGTIDVQPSMGYEELRARVVQLLGVLPEGGSLELSRGDLHRQDGVVREEVAYQTEPGERVRAWLLVPTSSMPAGGWPAVVACHQHGGIFEWGKSEPAGLSPDPMYHYGLELCRRGFVVICPDNLCFEDRRTPAPLLESSPELVGERYELFEFTARLLRGSTLQAKYLHDLGRAIDVLQQLPEVDPSRIGAIVHSLGGQEALWLSFVDGRISAAVSSCGFAPIKDILAAGINHNKAMYIPGLLTFCDLEDIVASLAPRPFMMFSGGSDRIFPVEGVQRLIAHARQAYLSANAAEHFEAVIFPGGHSFPEHLRDRAYDFLERHL